MSSRRQTVLRLSPRLVQLCRIISPVVDGTLHSAVDDSSRFGLVVDDDLVALARRRHRVGPLLHQAVVSMGGVASAAALGALSQERRENERRQAVAGLVLQSVAHRFSDNGIRWTLMKGLGLARQLYSDPALRPSADIDVLVSAEDFQPAIRALETHAFRNVTGHPRPPFKAAAAYLFRDVTFRGPIGPRIELHQRPLFIDGRHSRIAPLVPAVGCGPLPVPAVDSDLAHYLLGHGALCYWARLKWLVDLVPLLAMLDDAAKDELLSKSRRAQTASSICASLVLLRALFPGAALGPLESWMNSERCNPKVTRRLAHYVQALDAPDLVGRTPLDNRMGALQAHFSFSEAIVPRLRALTFGPASSILRAIARTQAP
jgi:hypothetical protein